MRFFYLIFKYLTSIVKPCVFKLFSLRKITKSNFFHHLPTLNIANLFMQSFASPLPLPFPIPHNPPHPPQKSRTTNQTPQIYAPPTQKGRNYRLYLRPFYLKIHRKGATIAYTHALTTQKTTERAKLSLIPTPFLPKKPQKGRNYRIYPRPFHPKNHRKGATIAHTSRKNCDNLC